MTFWISKDAPLPPPPACLMCENEIARLASAKASAERMVDVEPERKKYWRWRASEIGKKLDAALARTGAPA